MSYPSTLDSIPHVTDGATDAAAATVDIWIDAINALETYVGLSGDVAASSGTLTSQIKYLLAAPGGIARQDAAPSLAATNDLWIETDQTTRPLSIYYSGAWHLIGANALTLQDFDVHTATPADGEVLTWDDTNSRWAPAAATGGMTNPMGTIGDLIVGGTAGAPTALTVGSAGQILSITAGIPAWITAPYIADPSGAPVGAVLVKNLASTWTYLAPSSTSGDVLTSQGAGAVPAWAAVPAQVPGSDIPAPGGERVGSLLQWNGTIYDKLLPGSAGQVLTAHGDNNVVGSLLTWATPAAGTMTNPMTTTSDLIYATGGGTPARLPIGTSAQLLQVVAGAPAWASLGGQVVPTYFDWTYQGSAPSTPAALTGRTYWKTDGKFYGKNAAGTEYDLTAQPAAGSKHTIYDETTPLTARTRLTFLGGGVDASDNSGNDSSDVTIPGYYGQVKIGGSSQTLRHTLDLIAGTGVTLTPVDNSGGDATEVTVAASGSGSNPFTQPSVPGSPTWLNQGSATVTTLTSGVQFNYPSGGTGHTYRGVLLETGVASTWTRYVSFDMNVDPSLNTPSIGLLAYASGSGQFYHIGLASSATNNYVLVNIDRFTNTTTLAANRLLVRVLGPNRAWFRIEATGGGNLQVDLSYDGGGYWRNILNDSIASFFGANAIDGLGVGMDNNSSGAAFASTLRSYGSTAPDPTVAQ